ncbi:MAG: PEP-CTERM sorting domain-containing protein [Cyanobacteria bacterium J06648_10]
MTAKMSSLVTCLFRGARSATWSGALGGALMGLLAAATPAKAAQLAAGPNGEFVFDTENSVTDVTVLTGDTVTFGHGHTPFTTDPGNSIGTLNGGAPNSVLGIGEPQSGPFASSSVQVSWAGRSGGDTFLVNNSGLDFYIFESGNSDNIDTVAVSALGKSGPTDFFYERATNFTSTTSPSVGYWTFGYDLSWFGLAEGDAIQGLEVSNFSPFATVNPIAGFAGTGNRGFVDFGGATGELIEGGLGDRFLGTTLSACGPVVDDGGAGANSYYFSFCLPGFESFDTDPDLVYIVATGENGVAEFTSMNGGVDVPEPSSLVALVALAGWGIVRRKLA